MLLSVVRLYFYRKLIFHDKHRALLIRYRCCSLEALFEPLYKDTIDDIINIAAITKDIVDLNSWNVFHITSIIVINLHSNHLNYFRNTLPHFSMHRNFHTCLFCWQVIIIQFNDFTTKNKDSLTDYKIKNVGIINMKDQDVMKAGGITAISNRVI